MLLVHQHDGDLTHLVLWPLTLLEEHNHQVVVVAHKRHFNKFVNRVFDVFKIRINTLI